MFNVELYRFTKRENSTARPSSTPLNLSCLLKATSSILAPEIEIDMSASWNPSEYNYAHIATFSRYYWITDWTWGNGVWTASLAVDVLASWRTNIGNTSAYIVRASAVQNQYAYDSAYPVLTRQTRHTVAVNRMFLNPSGMSSLASGFYVVGIISKNGTSYYGFTWSMLQAFIRAIYSDSYVSGVLSEYSIQLYPEAKIAVDPTQYISSIRWYPCSYSASGGSGTIRYGYLETVIQVGPVDVTANAYNFGEGGIDYSSVQISEQVITLSGADWTHPQQNDRGEYLRLAPYSTYQLFFPPFGLIDLDPQEIANNVSLDIYRNTDLKTGLCTLTVKVISAGSTEKVIARTTALVGIDMPLSNIVQVGTTQLQRDTHSMQAALGAAGGIMSGNAAQAGLSLIGGLLSIDTTLAKDALNGELPHLFTAGGQGNASDLMGDPAIYITYRWVADDDNDDIGRPVLEIRQISTIPGYIKCDADGFSAPCYPEELTAIKGYMTGGFHYA